MGESTLINKKATTIGSFSEQILLSLVASFLKAGPGAGGVRGRVRKGQEEERVQGQNCQSQKDLGSY